MKIAYADPPYPGCAYMYPEQTEVDHVKLLEQLQQFDGWALSTNSQGLKELLHLCPANTRIAVWVKPWQPWKGADVAYRWEPVLFVPARKWKGFMRDWIAESITKKRGMIGAKPDRFCYWIFQMLGADPDDEFVDLFPGSGAASRAWQIWKEFELRRRITGEKYPLFVNKRDLAVLAKYPKRLGFSAALLGEMGGKKTSQKKAHAARTNGSKGGRPRKPEEQPA
jgi:hypothetical protein